MPRHVAPLLVSVAIVGAILVPTAPAQGATTSFAMPGLVTGTVTDATTSEPVEGVVIHLEPVGRPARTVYSAWPSGGYTESSGVYTSGAVPPGQYKVFFDTNGNAAVGPSVPGLASSWYPGVQFEDDAGVITVEEDQTTVVDIELNLASSISGTVVNSVYQSGSVTAFARSATGERWVAQETVYIQPGGTFSIHGLPGDADYRLWAQIFGGSPQLTQQWSTYYNGATSLDTSTAINVAEDADVTGVTISLPPRGPVDTRRISGSDRYETAALVSAEFESADIVFIADGRNFPDALSAAPVAAELGGPVLLTPASGLPLSVIAELERLNPSTVVIVGGEGSVSSAVEAEVEVLLGIDPVRIGGANRYATSRALARYGFPNYVEQVYVATGTNFPDALSAGALAGDGGFPVVLVNGAASSVDEETKTLIRDLGGREGQIIGLAGSVSQGIQDSLNTMDVPRTYFNRSGWGNRYATSMYLSMSYYFQRPAERLYLALGTKFPDALAGAALAGSQGAPLIIIQGNCVPLQIKEFIYGLGAREVVILGGPTGLTPAIDSLTPCAT